MDISKHCSARDENAQVIQASISQAYAANPPQPSSVPQLTERLASALKGADAINGRVRMIREALLGSVPEAAAAGQFAMSGGTSTPDIIAALATKVAQLESLNASTESQLGRIETALGMNDPQ